MNKLLLARAQLGTATSLFIQDKDPVSVHALACGGAEVLDGLAEHIEGRSMSTHIMANMPDLDRAELKRIRNKHWNAFKHFSKRDSRAARDDDELIESFSDIDNDAVLFSAWHDYLLVAKRLPPAAQVFQVWWYATNEQRMSPGTNASEWRSLFPGIMSVPRQEQSKRAFPCALTRPL